ncbi:hypothetical protein ACHAW5_011377 [Stephanodiscus triporus]|uniref:SAP domain-containing protein n=1 Tax=Stephanodiscus triporus TaxID=2934178 RepID=A0ABD3QRT6_9STRA
MSNQSPNASLPATTTSMYQENLRYRRSPRALATAATAASVAILHPQQAEAAFSTSTFALRSTRHPPSASARIASLLDGTLAPDTGSASTFEELPLRAGGPLHQSFQPLIMSMDELLKAPASKFKPSKLASMRQGSGALRQMRRLVSGGSSTTCLPVSRSTDNVLGFRVEDLEPYKGSNGDSDSAADELQFSFEDFDTYRDDFSLEIDNKARPAARTLNPQLVSSISQRVAASLPKKDGSSAAMKAELEVIAISTGSRSARPKSKSTPSGQVEEEVPPWLPWVPTETQINALRKSELQAACAERDLTISGKKPDLQQRLLIWATVQDRKRVKNRLSGLKDLIELSKSKGRIIEVNIPDVDFESYDVDALTNKRKALTKEKKRKTKRGVLGLVDESYFSNSTVVIEKEDDENDDEEELEEASNNSMINQESINQLSKTFNAPSSNFSNREVREMYMEAKLADQAGDRKHSKAILSQLREATPHDMRVVRRLARMEQEDGNFSSSRAILIQALRSEPENAHLLNGLAQLERAAGNDHGAKTYYRKAIKCDPTYPNPYHALGTLEHTHGNIRAALSVIKEGIRNCPYNHRLHHALGDVYMDANMLDLAEGSYLAGLQHGPEWSKPFFYTSLSFVSYAQGHTKDSRTLLRQSLDVNGGMHAQGVIALAQLEESEGNIEQARKVYRDALSNYEKKRRSRSLYRPTTLEKDTKSFETSSLGDGHGNQYARSYAGDKWINVFKSWCRMEQIHGTYETTHIVFGKAARLFPNDVSLLIQWAELQADHGEPKKARLLYEAACHRVGLRSAEPYQLFAEFEMKRKNFVEAQAILMKGAQAMSGLSLVDNPDGSVDGGKSGLARLFHTWGVCEYHLGTYSRAEQLFDNALRVTGSEEGDSAMRSLILYSMARLEFSRGEHLLAQHCIALSLKENLLPGGNSLTWKLWYQIAEKMGNQHLATRCKEQALLRLEEERGGAVSDLSRLLGGRDSMSSNGRLPERTGSAMKDMFRKTPWHSKVCPASGRMDKNWHNGARLWNCK